MSTGLKCEITIGQNAVAGLSGINYVIVNFWHTSYTSEFVKKSFIYIYVYVFKNIVALYAPVIFQNKMTLTSTLRGMGVTGLCLRQKIENQNICPFSKHRYILNRRLNDLSTQPLRNLLHHVNSLLTWVSLTVQA